MTTYNKQLIEATVAPGLALNPIRQQSRTPTNYTGTDIHYIGDRCFAYSGAVTVTGTPVNLLDFTTNASIIVGKIKTMQATAAAENDDVLASLMFNGRYIFRVTLGKNSFHEFDPGAVTETDIIIPPFTLVQVELDNLSGGSADMASLITGRVYAATTVHTGGL